MEKPEWMRDVTLPRRQDRELVLVYIGAQSCGPCNDPEYKASLAQLKSTVAEIARECLIVPEQEGSVPMVILLERNFVWVEHRIEPGPRKYLFRLRGIGELQSWLPRACADPLP